MQCPLCRLLSTSLAVKHLQTKYGDSLAFSYRHFPLQFYPTAMPAALTAECVGEVGGGSKFYDFINGIYTAGIPTNDVIASVLTSLSIDASQIKTCVDTKKFADKISTQTAEGTNMFGINATPGNVFIDTTTGKYEIVPGEFPEDQYDATIAQLLGQ